MKISELKELLNQFPDDADILLEIGVGRVPLEDTDITAELDIGVIVIDADY